VVHETGYVIAARSQLRGEEDMMRYVGVDIGKWKCRAALMDPEGSIIE